MRKIKTKVIFYLIWFEIHIGQRPLRAHMGTSEGGWEEKVNILPKMTPLPPPTFPSYTWSFIPLSDINILPTGRVPLKWCEELQRKEVEMRRQRTSTTNENIVLDIAVGKHKFLQVTCAARLDTSYNFTALHLYVFALPLHSCGLRKETEWFWVPLGFCKSKK